VRLSVESNDADLGDSILHEKAEVCYEKKHLKKVVVETYAPMQSREKSMWSPQEQWLQTEPAIPLHLSDHHPQVETFHDSNGEGRRNAHAARVKVSRVRFYGLNMVCGIETMIARQCVSLQIPMRRRFHCLSLHSTV
jgi:hypothetical protein